MGLRPADWPLSRSASHKAPVSPAQAGELLRLVADGTISGTIAKQVLEIMLETGATVQATLCDAGNACVWVPAAELGRTGSELAGEIDQDAGLIGTVR